MTYSLLMDIFKELMYLDILEKTQLRQQREWADMVAELLKEKYASTPLDTKKEVIHSPGMISQP